MGFIVSSLARTRLCLPVKLRPRRSLTLSLLYVRLSVQWLRQCVLLPGGLTNALSGAGRTDHHLHHPPTECQTVWDVRQGTHLSEGVNGCAGHSSLYLMYEKVCCTPIPQKKRKEKKIQLDFWFSHGQLLEYFCPSTALHSQSGTVYLQRLSPLPHPLSEDSGPLLSYLPQPCRLQYVHLTCIHVSAALLLRRILCF